MLGRAVWGKMLTATQGCRESVRIGDWHSGLLELIMEVHHNGSLLLRRLMLLLWRLLVMMMMMMRMWWRRKMLVMVMSSRVQQSRRQGRGMESSGLLRTCGAVR